ncbi:MAG TPA: hypothetical protein VKU39_04305 [Streptosporangiaceae bacterium]|nr:hypothetical protein [Streptosporangiaceae bacterium]
MDVISRPAGWPEAPELLGPDEVAMRVAEAAVWAPSVHNTQPWWFSIDGQEISVHADARRQLMVADPDGREMMISCGAALFTARLALRSLGYLPETRVLPDPARPSLVATVSWQDRAAPAEHELRLFSQVRLRRTHRGGFGLLPLAPELLGVLRQGAERDDAILHVITDEGARSALAMVVEEAERAQRLDSARVRELAAWVPAPGSTRRDGVPRTAYPAHCDGTCPHFPGRDFAHGRGWGLLQRVTGTGPGSAGQVCLLATADDRPRDWVNAGQALQRVLLTSAACGVAAALHSQPLELAWLREFTRQKFTGGSYPQLVLRLGTVIQTAVSVRRPVTSVLFASGEPVGNSAG